MFTEMLNRTNTPPTHRYQTRSSQSPPQVQQEATSQSSRSHTPRYQMSADIVVKETVYGRDHNGKRLQPQVFEGDSWEEVQLCIFNFVRPHLSSLSSHVSNPCEWSASSQEPTIADFDSYVSIKTGRNHFRPESASNAQQYLADHVQQTFNVSVFKWGNKINSAADLQEFQLQCVLPQAQDRAGAAAEALHQETVFALKSKWGDDYSAYEATWRMWAANTLRRPSHEHESLIATHPPVQLIHLFQSVPNGAQQSVIESMERQVRPHNPVDGIEGLLEIMPNTNDIDHEEEEKSP
ncbi:unnamed protein product [Aphanomyces euteiches]